MREFVSLRYCFCLFKVLVKLGRRHEDVSFDFCESAACLLVRKLIETETQAGLLVAIRLTIIISEHLCGVSSRQVVGFIKST